MRRLPSFTALAGMSLLTGCTVQYAVPAYTADVTVAPPEPLMEVVGTPPDDHYTWVNGYWWWNGDQHVWMRGHWAPRPAAGYVWVRSGWTWLDGRYVFVHGRWIHRSRLDRYDVRYVHPPPRVRVKDRPDVPYRARPARARPSAREGR
ncbi:MAG: hypothetical protein ACOCXM_03700 [Myxococcota bacterium]